MYGRFMEKWPENTDIAFEEALRVGSHGLETGSRFGGIW